MRDKLRRDGLSIKEPKQQPREKLLEKLMKLKPTQLEESLMREQILLEEFSDDYFFNRENRRVISDPKS